MKKIVTPLLVINMAGLLAIGVWLFINNQKVVYVDSIKLINSYEGMAKARGEYQQKAMGWKANIDTLAKDLETRVAAYKKDVATMSSREKKMAEELLTLKQKQLTEYQQALTQKAQSEDAEMTRAVLVEINAYLKTYGESKGYKIILAATDYGNIAYAEPGLNITEEVLAGLNKQYAK